MLVSNIKFILGYAILALGLSLIISLIIHPTRKSWWDTKPHYFLKAEVHNPWVFNKVNLGSKKINLQMFRGNEKRQGLYNSKITSLSKLKINLNKPVLQDINVGIHSASKSSPLVTDKYIITVSDFGVLQVFDKKTKVVLWKLKSYSAQSGFHATPALMNKNVIVGDYDGRLYSINLDKLALNWVIDLGDALGASPAIDNKGFIYVSVEQKLPDGYIAKIDPQDGHVLWTSEFLGDQGHSSPTLSLKHNLVLVGDNTGSFSAFDMKTGNRVWKMKTDKPIKATGAIYQDEIVFSSWDGYIYSLDIEDGKIKWKIKFEENNQSSIAIIESLGVGFINSAENGLCQINLKKPKINLCTNISNQKSSSRLSSPIVTNHKNNSYIVWSPCSGKDICAFDAISMRLINKWNLNSGVSGEMVFYNEELFFVTDQDGGLYQLDIKNEN